MLNITFLIKKKVRIFDRKELQHLSAAKRFDSLSIIKVSCYAERLTMSSIQSSKIDIKENFFQFAILKIRNHYICCYNYSRSRLMWSIWGQTKSDDTNRMITTGCLKCDLIKRLITLWLSGFHCIIIYRRIKILKMVLCTFHNLKNCNGSIW